MQTKKALGEGVSRRLSRGAEAWDFLVGMRGRLINGEMCERYSRTHKVGENSKSMLGEDRFLHVFRPNRMAFVQT